MSEIQNMLQSKLMTIARDKALEILRAHGNAPTKQHEIAIEQVAKEISTSVTSDKSVRLAIPLETGMGKTTSIIAAIYAMQSTELSAVICVESVEQQHELYQELLKAGVENRKLGKFHKMGIQKPEYPSIDIREVERCQFLIVCHNKVYSDSKKVDDENHSSIDWMNTYRGKERSICFWDERLEPKSCFTLSRAHILSALGSWIPLYQSKKQSLQIYEQRQDRLMKLLSIGDWIVSAHKVLTDAEEDGLIDLAKIDVSLLDAKTCLEYINSKREGAVRDNEHILELIKYSQIGKIRMMLAANQNALIQFQAQIHDGFKRLIIFDATMPIRELSKYDKSVRVMELDIRKSYKDVVINWCPTYSSKDQLTNHRDKRRNLDSYYEEIDLILKHEMPQNENLLIFTFKDIKDEVEEHFKHSKYRSRVQVVHWGAHKASNRLSNIKFIATLGVLRRNPADLIANILGAKNNIQSNVSFNELKAVEHTEMADMLIQGFGRGHNRVTKSGGFAGETNIWLYLPDKDEPVITAIKAGMRDLVVKKRLVGKHFQRVRDRKSKTETIADQIELILSSSKAETLAISELRELFDPPINSQDKLWHRGLMRFLVNKECQWLKKGKSICLAPISDRLN